MQLSYDVYIYMVSNCCYIVDVRQGPGKCFWGPGKVLEIFVTEKVGGNPGRIKRNQNTALIIVTV